MNRNIILNQLNIKDDGIVYDFILEYIRFEYALKRAGYLKKGSKNKVEANWEKFISDVCDKFQPERDPKLKKAVDYLLKTPSHEQIIKNNQLEFLNEVHIKIKEGSITSRVYHSIRIIRNNLFHGGKFPIGPREDVGRDSELIKSSLVVLEEFLTLNDVVKNYFYEGV